MCCNVATFSQIRTEGVYSGWKSIGESTAPTKDSVIRGRERHGAVGKTWRAVSPPSALSAYCVPGTIIGTSVR